jgi:hypothetical protein
MRIWGVLVAFLVAAMAACELAEVAAPEGEDVLVAESVLRVGLRQQFLILHHSLEGRAIRGEPGATVLVTTAAGLRVQFQEATLRECLVEDVDDWGIDSLQVNATCYASPLAAGRFVTPDQTYELSVQTVGGKILRGRTTVPSNYSFRTPAVAVSQTTRMVTCRLANTPFDLTWTHAEGAWAYLSSLELTDWGESLLAQGIEVPNPLELTGVSVSASDTTLLFPENLGVFQRFDLDQRLLLALQGGLPADANATLVILAADRNYTNGVRGGRFNPSGNIRTSSVVGDGIGVFGSVVPLIIRSPEFPGSNTVPKCGA